MTNARWGMPEDNHTNSVKKETIVQQEYNRPNDDLALRTASMTVEALSKVTDKLENENKHLKSVYTSYEEINKRLSASNDKLSEENANLKAKLEQMSKYNASAPAYNTGGVVNHDNDSYSYGAAQMLSRVTTAQVYAPRVEVSPLVKYETPYKAPVNPMTVFIEFLEELDILEEYTAILLKDGNSFENLCNQYEPYMYISEVCTDDDGEYLEGWEEADTLWSTIVEDDNLNEEEAYIEQ